ncbi:MAG: hypothetical protein KGL18_09375, partial [Burkholderiales bacterium]|nr:hypothetical protein [Burkholderiales bacterium]
MKPAAVVEPAQAEAAAVPGADACWHLQMLGGLLARSGDWRIERWPSRPVALLLARLALYPQRSHAREELIELIWPGVALDAGRNRLRVALSTLRGLLEPPGAPRILVAERQTLRLHEAAIECDALAFEHAARAGRDARALALYRGELLPGHYDDWVVEERRRLETLHQRLREREALPAQAPASAAAAARAARPDAA